MKLKSSRWTPLLLGLLLLAALVGVALARPEGAPLGAKAKVLTLGATDCHPRSDNQDFFIAGSYLRGEAGGGPVFFWCPVNFPEPGKHRIHAITLYAYDQHTWQGYDVKARAYRANPATGAFEEMGLVQSTGSSATKPRAFTIKGAQINPKVVYPGHKMSFFVWMEGHMNLWFYGLRIRYVVL